MSKPWKASQWAAFVYSLLSSCLRFHIGLFSVADFRPVNRPQNLSSLSCFWSWHLSQQQKLGQAPLIDRWSLEKQAGLTVCFLHPYWIFIFTINNNQSLTGAFWVFMSETVVIIIAALAHVTGKYDADSGEHTLALRPFLILQQMTLSCVKAREPNRNTNKHQE